MMLICLHIKRKEIEPCKNTIEAQLSKYLNIVPEVRQDRCFFFDITELNIHSLNFCLNIFNFLSQLMPHPTLELNIPHHSRDSPFDTLAQT